MSNNAINAFRQKDVKKLVRIAIQQGFTLSVNGKEHARIQAPDGQHTSLSFTSKNAVDIARNNLRKIGVKF